MRNKCNVSKKKKFFLSIFSSFFKFTLSVNICFFSFKTEHCCHGKKTERARESGAAVQTAKHPGNMLMNVLMTITTQELLIKTHLIHRHLSRSEGGKKMQKFPRKTSRVMATFGICQSLPTPSPPVLPSCLSLSLCPPARLPLMDVLYLG